MATTAPEGKSIVATYAQADRSSSTAAAPKGAEFVPFTAQSRMSGVNLPNGVEVRKGAPDAIVRYVEGLRGAIPPQLDGVVAKVAARGASPLVVAENARVAARSRSRTSSSPILGCVWRS